MDKTLPEERATSYMIKKLFSSLCLIVLVIGTSSYAAEWTDLFDGKTLDGWHKSVEGDAQVVDGEIHMVSKGKNLWLVHNQTFENFEFEAQAFMPEDDYNSGIAFRATDKGAKPIGYQCEIWSKKTGSIYGIGKGTVLPASEKEWDSFYQVAGDCFKAGQWNTIRIRCEGTHIQIWVNDHQTADINNELWKSGVFALQHHGKGGVHKFRQIRVRTL